ncbi:alpha/beta hydrolase [Streptosporangium carneum]|uniref:Proteinase n=1 Tax=Streptosporangium carneum TaxID=47481 RepID=A0A9W6HW86_9ACTN|nr:alpha/beta hydrolase [Streptosporangium carneum]GLK06713.1 proteinase [Streptosporangium carneum]
MRLPRTAAALAALALFTTACSGAGATGTGAANGGAEAGKASGKPSSTLAWTGCGDDFECARLGVPLDHGKPDGEKIEISLIRLPATGDRIGSILINPGGPGASGVDYARNASSVLSDAVRARFDVVGFDPRGVGGSSPVRCLPSNELDAFNALDSSPDSPQEIAALEEGARHYVAGCQARSGKLLPHVGTVDAAKDMDLLRAALGDERLTYLGKSYGTQLGAVYADLFPERVRALVLDGAVDPSLSPLEMNATQARGFEVALDAFLEDCLTAAGCPFDGTVESARGQIADLLRKTDQAPLTNRTADRRQVSESWTVLGLVTPLYDRQAWPILRKALGEALKGDGTTLLRMADLLVDRNRDGSYSNQTEANSAVNCVDSSFPQSSSDFAAAARDSLKDAPMFGPYIMWGSLPCAYWPVKQVPRPKIDAPGAAPIMVVGTERDPATPYEWAKSLADQLSSGILVDFDGDGHTAYRSGSTCVDRLVDDYLINLVVPKDGVRCPKIS